MNIAEKINQLIELKSKGNINKFLKGLSFLLRWSIIIPIAVVYFTIILVFMLPQVIWNWKYIKLAIQQKISERKIAQDNSK